MKKDDRIIEEQEIDGIEGMLLVDAIEALQAALVATPEEYRSIATLRMEAYDWGSTWIEIRRPPNAAELAESERLKADRALLIEKSTMADMDEWIRQVRLSRHCSRETALEMIKDGTEQVWGHPRYNRKTKTVIL